MDGDGEIFKPVESSDEMNVPVVTGITLSDIDFNDPLNSRPFRAVMETLRSCQVSQNMISLHALHRIHVDRELGLTLYAFFPQLNMPYTSYSTPPCAGNAGRQSKDGGSVVEIKMGFGDYESKYNRLRSMVSHLKKESGLLNPQSINLVDLDRVVVRPSPVGQTENCSVSEGHVLWPNRRKEV